MDYRKIKNRIICLMCLFIVVAVVIVASILNFANDKQIRKASRIMLDQIDNILDANDENEKEILAQSKEEYIGRAKAVAYILENNEVAQTDINEQKRIAAIMNIDEICLFDDKGLLYGGTEPHYYGLTFDSGEQVSFFKPMLNDKNLSMCQDVTPNTATSKSMMYAIVWDNTQTYMIQVGIEPVRLLDEFKNNSINSVINKMPVYEGMNIYVANRKTGRVLGSTDKSTVGLSIYNTKVLNEKDDLQTIGSKIIHIDGFKNYCYYQRHGDYIIATVHSTKANVESFLVSITIELIWLLLAGCVIVYTLLRLINANKKISSQMAILSSISDIYYSMHLIDMSDYSIEKLEGNELMDRVIDEGENAVDMMDRIIRSTIEDEYIDAALAFADFSTLAQRLKDKNTIFMDVINRNVGWLRMSFITVETNADKLPTKIIIATQIIDEDKKREVELSIKANRDELTGLFNRRAYEDDILNYPDVPPEEDFVYLAIDINGLKVVNDECGHAAGDEMICGASDCLKRTLGNYGRVYRTGGDEFVAMIFAKHTQLQPILDSLDLMTLEWKGAMAPSLSLSVGYATKQEFTKETVKDMAKIADERMYKAKAEYYSQKGIDRRGQAAAHTALCNLYTKILKINITNDTYSIVNMDVSERTANKGFSERISEWLHDFAKSGQVHEEDIEEYLKLTDINYLRDYFMQDKTSISIFYRRKIEDSYKQVVMEIIPADDYSKTSQSLYLYVKAIDR